MGIAIINQNADYSLERVAQNVIPTDPKYRKLLTTSGTFSYGNVSAQGICKLNMVDLKGSTQPYLYKICNSSGTVISKTGVSINEISGVITLSTGYDGQDVYVKLEPQIVTGYYDSAIPGLITKAINAGSWSGDTPTYSNLSVSTFTYNTVDSSGGSISPTISYSYTKTTSSGSTTGSTEGTITYSFASNSHEGASIISTNGNVTFTANPPSERLYEVNARIVLPDGTNGTFSTNVKQTAAQQQATLESISAVAINSETVAGSTISASDFTVTGHYSDNSTKTLTTSINVSPTEISYGNNNITVSYGSGIKTCTVTIQGYDKITAVSYNRPTELTSVPNITATLDNQYTGYNSYATSGNNPKLYNFELTATMSTSSQDYTFAKLSEVNTAKGNVVFDVTNLPDGGVITDTNLPVTITNTSDSSDVINATIQSPLTSLASSNGWNNDLTALNRAGTSLIVIAVSSGPTAYEVITSYTPDGHNPWDWYVCDVPDNANYLIIETTGLDNGVHSVIMQSNDGVEGNKVQNITSLIYCFLGRTNIYKVNRNVTVNSDTKIYITHIHNDSLEDQVSVKVKFLESLT